MFRQLTTEWRNRRYSSNFYLFNNRLFHRHKYKLFDAVRVTKGCYNYDEIGIITRMPDWKHVRPYYEISTETYPYGQWVKRSGFYPLDNSWDQVKKAKKIILKKRYMHKDLLRCKPTNVDPRALSANMELVGYNKNSLNEYGFIVWVEPGGFIPHAHIVFPGDEYGKEATICLGSNKYWHKLNSKKLTDDEKSKLQDYFSRVWYNDETCWQLAADAWFSNIASNKNTLHKRIYRLCIEDKRMPDYTKLK